MKGHVLKLNSPSYTEKRDDLGIVVAIYYCCCFVSYFSGMVKSTCKIV